MGDNHQQNYQANMTGGETSKRNGASVIPSPRKHVSTMVAEKTTKFVMGAVKSVKNKNKINPVHKYGHKSKLMVASIRNKQDVFNVLGVDYIITPLKILQALKESVTPDDDKYTFVKRLSSQSAAAYNFTDEELVKWDQLSFASGMGPAALELLASGMDGYTNQAKRVEELFGKIWPPPNV